VRQLEAELAACQAHDAERQRQWDGWLTLVSHDLRSPLTLVLGYSQGLLRSLPDGKDAERYRRDLNGIVYGARRVDKMIGQIVDAARLEAGHVAVDRRGLDLGTIVREELKKLRRVYPDRAVRTGVPEDLPLILGDARRVGQILGTFLSNAVTFSPPDAPIALRAWLGDDRVNVAVTDRGVGLTEEEKPRIFERYYRPERLREARREGLGLSLAVAAELAALLGAEIAVDSAGVDRGSTFTLRLQVAEALGAADDEE
jgi:signal transduction histidine kinase